MHWRRVGDRGCALSWVLGKRKRLALRIPGRAQRRPVWLFGGLAPTPLLAAPAPGRLRGGSRASARLLRDLTRRGCPSAPRNRHGAGLPRSEAKESQTEGLPFLW